MRVQRVHLIRHGQTAWNVAGRWQGFEAVPLNETGLAQARALAAYWSGPLDAVYSSDLPRAWQTAQPLASARHVPLVADPRLREVNLGIFQGLTFDEMRARYPNEAEALMADWMGYVVPQGESRAQLQARVYEAWREIVERESGTVALVSHGTAIKVLLFKLFGETPELRSLHIDNTSITTLEWGREGWRLTDLAITPHLAAAPQDLDPH